MMFWRKNPTSVETLTAMLAGIRERGLTQGHLGKPTGPQCLLGHYNTVMGREYLGAVGKVQKGKERDHLARLQPLLSAMRETGSSAAFLGSIVSFNDTAPYVGKDVLATVERALEIARTQEVQTVANHNLVLAA